MGRTSIISLLLLPLAGATGLLAQEPTERATAAAQEVPPRFPAEVEQVVVDVVVVDKKGNPVTGLTRDDMKVLEDGVLQTIDTFEAIELPEEPARFAPPAPRVSTNTGVESQRGRTFVIIFDDLHLTPQKARVSKEAVASFLENGVREGDLVTLIASSGAVWWTARMNSGRDQLLDATKRLTGRKMREVSNERITEWEAVQIHVFRNPEVMMRVLRRYDALGVAMPGAYDRASPVYGTVDDPMINANAQGVYFENSTRDRILLEVLERALNGLQRARGRKSVILVSEGFVYDPQQEGFRAVKEASLRSNTPVYFLNSRGLETVPGEFSLEFGPALPAQDMGRTIAGERFEATAGTESIAEDTGGFTVRNTNDLDKGIQRIARETRAYYLLGYVPTSTARDGKFREIDVKLRDGKGLKVRARRGYYAPSEEERTPPGTETGADPAMQAALDSPWAEDGVPLRMTEYVGAERLLGKAATLIVAEVDLREVTFEEVDGRAVGQLDFYLVVSHRETGEYFNYNQDIDLKLRPETRARLERRWLPIARDFELPPGDYQAKMVIRDATSAAVGSVIHEFVVPPLGDFRVSSPVLSDTLRKTEPGQPPEPELLARREFPQDAKLVWQFEVFGAAKDDAGLPHVVQGIEVRGIDGAVVRSMQESRIKPTSIGHLSRITGFTLNGLAPGGYEVRMTLRDELAGKTLRVVEPFTVIDPGADGAS